MSRTNFFGLLLLSITCLTQSSQVFGQGLIWNAPEPGTWVRYEGDYDQTDERPDLEAKALKLNWRRHLTIKALAKDTVDVKGQPVECQWFELKVVTGVSEDGLLVPGPGGKRIYKVLVPLDRAKITPPKDNQAKVVDAQQIPIAYLPIVEGYRKIDEQEETPISTGVFHTYPLVTLLAHYRKLEVFAEDEDPQVTLAGVTSTTHYSGQVIMESPKNRSTNKAEIWASQTIPFGLARWKVAIDRETKDGKAKRMEYQKTSSLTIDMKIVEQGTDAMSEIKKP